MRMSGRIVMKKMMKLGFPSIIVVLSNSRVSSSVGIFLLH